MWTGAGSITCVSQNAGLSERKMERNINSNTAWDCGKHFPLFCFRLSKSSPEIYTTIMSRFCVQKKKEKKGERPNSFCSFIFHENGRMIIRMNATYHFQHLWCSLILQMVRPSPTRPRAQKHSLHMFWSLLICSFKTLR